MAKALKHIGDPIALAAIKGLPEGWFVEVGNAKKLSVPPAPPGGKMPRNIPGYPTTE